MTTFIYIVFSLSSVLILIWLVQTLFKTARQNAQMRQEIYNREVEAQFKADAQEIDDDKQQ